MTASLRRTIVTVVVLTAVALMTAGCSGGDRGGSHHPRGAVASLRATSDHRAAYPGSAWASSKARGQAFGTIWRKETRNPKDRDGRGIDAWTWAGRTCDAVRNGGQTPEAMVQRVHDEGRFTQQGARVIVSAALSALCPAQGASTQLLP